MRVKNINNNSSNNTVLNSADYVLYAIPATLLLLTIFSFVVLSSPRSSAITGTASGSTSIRASVNVSASCSMYGTIAEGEDHTATIQNGRYQEDIGITTIKTFCNDPSGYAIYAVGYTNNDIGNNHLTSASLPTSNDIISTATHLDGTASDWGMKLTPTGTSYIPTVISPFSNYAAVPTTYTKVVEYGSNTDVRDENNPNAIGSSFTTTYAASVSPTQPTGTYTGQVKYVLVHPSVEDLPDVDTMQNVALWGGSVLVGETVTATDSRDNNTYKVSRLCTNWSGNNCTESELWMTQNLDLAIGAANTATLTSRNTDLNEYKDSSGNTLDGYTYNTTTNTITWTPAATVNNTMATLPANRSLGTNSGVAGWTDSQRYPYQAEGGAYYVAGDNEPLLLSQQGCTNTYGANTCAHYHVGNYYNWTAAVASNDSQQNPEMSQQFHVMPNSICPAGWRLPNGLTSSDGTTSGAITQTDFNKVLSANGIANGVTLDTGAISGGANVNYQSGGLAKMSGAPYYLIRSGGVANTTLYTFGTGGRYWSSTAVSSDYAYLLYFGSDYLAPAYRFLRYEGRSLRCLAR